MSWVTVRISLVLSSPLGSATHYVDCSIAFCQAPLDQTVFVELLEGFEIPNTIFHLQTSVYGLRQSPLNFYRYLRDGLENRECIKSNHDDCLFTNGEFMVLFWVDDCIFHNKDNNLIGSIISGRRDGFCLN